MNEHEDVERLIKLLALKRHEQPPPGYFDRLPGRILARIGTATARRQTLFERLIEEAGWFGRFWNAFETKPVFAGAMGVVVTASLVGGFLLASQRSQEGVSPMLATENIWKSAATTPLEVPALPNSFALLPADSLPVGNNSTNPIFNTKLTEALFYGGGLQTQPAAFPIHPR